MEIKSLEGVPFNLIYNAFSSAFEEYEVQLNKQQLIKMLKRRGFDPGLSFAFFDNCDMVAFILNGIGNFGGIATAYDTGTGTLKEYRGKGLATELFNYSIPFLRQRNIRQYLLEVIQSNTRAVSVYTNLGFGITREFNYYIRDKSEFIGTENGSRRFDLVRLDGLYQLSELSSFWDFYPSWQNGFEAIERDKESFEIIGAYDGQTLAGYCVHEPESGDITQIAVNKNYRRKKIATHLLSAAVSDSLCNVVKIINTETSCRTISDFLLSAGMEINGKQFEMLKNIDV